MPTLTFALSTPCGAAEPLMGDVLLLLYLLLDCTIVSMHLPSYMTAIYVLADARPGPLHL